MANERPPTGPPHPLPKDYKPHAGEPYRVKDGDTWKTVAFHWFINEQDLIWFNFKTLNSDEVNWYLRRNVGCTKQTPDRFNYVFSSRDKPGIIYIPPRKPIVFHDALNELSDRIGSQTDLGKALRNAETSDSLYDYLGFSLNVSDFALTTLAISGVELGALGLGLDLFGAVTAFVSVLLTLGGPHLGAVNSIKTDKALSGLSRGMVMGAAGETATFIRDHFVVNSADHNVDYPQERKNFQAAYLWGLLKGLEYGRKLTKSERLLFFKHLDFLVGMKPPGEFYMNRQSKGAKARENYYIDCAARFRKESTQ